MINLSIIKKDDFESTPLIYNFYDDINGIPLEIIFDLSSKYREGINISNYDEETREFITFKFDKETNVLCDITVVSINEEKIIYEGFKKKINHVEGNYQFYINNINSDFIRTNYAMKLMYDSDHNSILICFNNIDLKKMDFYCADENLLLGVNSENNLASIFLRNLKNEEIKQFLNL